MREGFAEKHFATMRRAENSAVVVTALYFYYFLIAQAPTKRIGSIINEVIPL